MHARKARTADERGAVLVEFSLVVVLFVALLYGLIAYGMAFALKESMTNAASEAARSAVGATDEAGAKAAAYTTADQRLDWLGPDRCCEHADGTGTPGAHLDVDADPTVGCGSGQCIKVTMEYAYGDSPLVPILRLPGFSYLFPETITSEATVQYGP